tara:strand:+ start:7093 stop:7260 length:168 start_codon:yes stop_codon:yes gene_type:complete
LEEIKAISILEKNAEKISVIIMPISEISMDFNYKARYKLNVNYLLLIADFENCTF